MFGKTQLKDQPMKWTLVGAIMLFAVLVSAQLVTHALTLLLRFRRATGSTACF
jgi:hypothetical protein